MRERVKEKSGFAMAKNSDFLLCKEERNQKSFFKVLQGVDTSSENMRAIPHEFVRHFSDNELSGTMKLTTKWGRSWEVKISKNPRFYFMEKSGWEKFVRENFLGNHEYLTFTHKGNMCFTVNIFNPDNREMVQPRQSSAFLASSSRIKTEQGEGLKKEEVVVSSKLKNHVLQTRAVSNGGGIRYKRKLDFGEKKAEEAQTCKRIKKVTSTVRRGSAPASSFTTAAKFTIQITKSYFRKLVIPRPFVEDHMPKTNTTFKIYHPVTKERWSVVCCVKEQSAVFSGGWRRLAREYPLALGDTCKFKLIKPDEMVLFVSKP